MCVGSFNPLARRTFGTGIIFVQRYCSFIGGETKFVLKRRPFMELPGLNVEKPRKHMTLCATGLAAKHGESACIKQSATTQILLHQNRNRPTYQITAGIHVCTAGIQTNGLSGLFVSYVHTPLNLIL